MSSGYYVYAIVAADQGGPDSIAGIEDAALALIRCGSLAAVVERSAAERIRPTAANVLHHEAVVEALRRAMPLLPVRFGTVLPDIDAIVRSIEERYRLLESDLARLGETYEFGLLVRWNPTNTVDSESPAHREADVGSVEAASQAGDGRRYLQARVAEHQRERELRTRAERLAHAIDAALADEVIDQRRMLVPTPQLALRSTYLVEQARIDAFRSAFAQLRRSRPEHSFLLSGPWPPYSFVTQPEVSAEATLWSWLRQFSDTAP